MRRAYFEDGAIIESTCGKAQFKGIVRTHRRMCKLADGRTPRVWFKPCDEWKRASDKELAAWRKTWWKC